MQEMLLNAAWQKFAVCKTTVKWSEGVAHIGIWNFYGGHHHPDNGPSN
jgi:hypothetical protein